MTSMIDSTAAPRRVFIDSALTEAEVEELSRSGDVHLVLDEGQGWNGRGIELVSLLAAVVTRLTVSHSKALDISAIGDLSRLEFLGLSGGLRGRFDFGRHALCALALYTRPRSVVVTGCPAGLARISGRLDQATLNAVSSAGGLRAMTLVKSNVESLPPASNLQELELLQVMDAPVIETIQPALEVAGLQFLRAVNCRNLSINTPVISSKLKYVAVHRCKAVGSLDLFSASKGLEAVSMHGGTVVLDGRLHEFSRRDALVHMSITSRKGYDVDPAELQKDPARETELARELEGLS